MDVILDARLRHAQVVGDRVQRRRHRVENIALGVGQVHIGRVGRTDLNTDDDACRPGLDKSRLFPARVKNVFAEFWFDTIPKHFTFFLMFEIVVAQIEP